MLEHVNEYKYLSLHLDGDLNWNQHISGMRRKMSKRLSVLRKVGKHLNLDTTKILYNALVLPVFD